MQFFLKMLRGMANSIDPDQSAPSLLAYTILSETLVYQIFGHLPQMKYSHVLSFLQ